MQCLYCHKRLGLFASKKRPFCSQLHEEWYQDEQSGSLIRRLRDPFEFAPPQSPASEPETVLASTIEPEAPPQSRAPEPEPALASTIEPEPPPMPIAAAEPAPTEASEPPRLEQLFH